MKTIKLIQLAGLLVTGAATIVFTALLVMYSDQLLGSGSNETALLGVGASFLAGIGGIGLFLVGRLIAWWKRND